jgi:hypothetical protein
MRKPNGGMACNKKATMGEIFLIGHYATPKP